MKISFLLFLSIFSACTNNAYRGNDVVGVEEFILDSYQILEKKTEIDNTCFSKNLVPQKKIAVRAGMPLLETLSLAQVSKRANLSRSYLVRDNQLLPIHLCNLQREQDVGQNIVLKRNDKICIIENSCIMVLGKVRRETSIDSLNGTVSLKQALACAGGILPSGDKAYIQIFRGNILQSKVYTVHEKYVRLLPKHSMLLIPGDIVYIAAKPFTTWSFIVNQQLPNFIAFDLLKKRCSLEITVE